MHFQQVYSCPSVSVGDWFQDLLCYNTPRMLKSHSRPALSADLAPADSASVDWKHSTLPEVLLNPRMRNPQILRANSVEEWNCWSQGMHAVTLGRESQTSLQCSLLPIYRATSCPTFLLAIDSIVRLFSFCHSSKQLVVSYCLNLHFLLQMSKHLFICLSAIWMYSCEVLVYEIHLSLMNYVIDLEGWSHILTEVLCQIDCYKCLLPSCCLPFHSTNYMF